MEDYFVQSERKNISEVYTAINHKFSTEDTVNTLYLERLATNNNLKIIIAQPVRDLTGISLETKEALPIFTRNSVARPFRHST